MNIRKKIIYNPSHLKSTEPDSSDNTTANTKNSAILEQSKTFRLANITPFSSQRSKNYLRSLSKQIKKQNSVCIQNGASILVKKNHVMPSFSTLSNQNLPPLKKGIINRKFIIESEQLPPLSSAKRPNILSSQNERKPPILPSSQISSYKDLFKPNSLSRKQFHGHGKIPINRILGNEVQQIQRRKQQLNSMNAGSFYTSHKSIALSKFSIGSKQSSRNQNLSKNSDQLSIQRQKRPSQFLSLKKQQENLKSQQVEVVAQSNVEESMQESIAEEIQRNKSLNKQKITIQKKQSNIDNQWNETLKSSLYESKTVEVRMPSNNEKQDTQQSSLCESQEIDDRQLEEKKKTCRLMNSSKKTSQQKKYSFNKDEDFCLQTFKSQLEQSSLCQSYQMQTPQKHNKSKESNSN